jgi:hypothetical protein
MLVIQQFFSQSLRSLVKKYWMCYWTFSLLKKTIWTFFLKGRVTGFEVIRPFVLKGKFTKK